MSRFGAKRKPPGAEFSWEADVGGPQDTEPTPLFPKYHVPRAKPLSDIERRQVNCYRKLREQIHDGPYYVVLPSRPEPGVQTTPSTKSTVDPFQGMATYGQRYLKKTKTLPKLTGRPYIMNFFPKELWTTLDPKYVGVADGANGIGGLKLQGRQGFEDDDEDLELPDTTRRRRDGEDGDEEGSDTGEKGREENDLDEDEEGEEEIEDNDYEEDDDDMGGDYDAEQYFDDGDDDDGFDGGGGGGDEDAF